MRHINLGKIAVDFRQKQIENQNKIDKLAAQQSFKNHKSIDEVASDDIINGGNDTLKGGEGNDVLYGAFGNNCHPGWYGNNYFHGGDGNDFLLDGEGKDIFEYKQILTEYYKLSTCLELSELDEKRLDKILKQAESDAKLSFLLNEIDELTYQELGFYESSSLENCENQKAKVKEFILNSEKDIFEYKQILTEYYKLSTCLELSELDEKRLDKILKQAESDAKLSFLLNEIDELTYQELGFYESSSLENCENQKAKVKEFILSSIRR